MLWLADKLALCSAKKHPGPRVLTVGHQALGEMQNALSTDTPGTVTRSLVININNKYVHS
jgi:hypothetical protein